MFSADRINEDQPALAYINMPLEGLETIGKIGKDIFALIFSLRVPDV